MHLTVHISKHRAVEEKRFSCPKCDKSFHSNYYLSKHIKIHDERVKKSIKCPNCHKWFVFKMLLIFFITTFNGFIFVFNAATQRNNHWNFMLDMLIVVIKIQKESFVRFAEKHLCLKQVLKIIFELYIVRNLI